MDDQQTPLPHHAPPVPMPVAVPEAHQPPPHRPHRVRRAVATLAATALVAGVGGVGLGYTVGNAFRGNGTTPAASGTENTGTSGTGGVQSIPGSGRGWSDGGPDVQGGVPIPVDPNAGGGSTGGQGQSTGTTTKASGSQLTGLVRIVSTMKYAGATAAGTGMVLTSNGEVVTNHHVVEGATSVKVKVMTTGKTYAATVVGRDAEDDVAVLQLTGASGLSTVTPDTDGIAVGDDVTAVGDAGGTASYLSAAAGQVLAKNRSITTQSEGSATGERLTGLIEISSDVISGDSGGATYDADGQVVGMTTAASRGGDIVGYAVPIAKVLRIVDDLDSGVAGSRYDYGSPAFLGVGLARTGTTVEGVYDGTPAAKAGIAAGDRITAIGSTRVSTSARLRKAVAAHSPGDAVRVTWTDARGDSHTRTVTLVAGPVQ